MDAYHPSDLFNILTDRIILDFSDHSFGVKEHGMVGFDRLRSSQTDGCAL